MLPKKLRIKNCLQKLYSISFSILNASQKNDYSVVKNSQTMIKVNIHYNFRFNIHCNYLPLTNQENGILETNSTGKIILNSEIKNLSNSCISSGYKIQKIIQKQKIHMLWQYSYTIQHLSASITSLCQQGSTRY